MMIDVPDFQDDVRHKKQREFIGRVIAKYPDNKVMLKSVKKDGIKKSIKKNLGIQSPSKGPDWFLDVQLSDRIVYETPAENWETIRTEEERLNQGE